ncbi:MAG: hypothetical protein C7B44_11325 [Sulfobacillus thermosulfidooxidans]|uniref:Uncharacterized protein n=1 Tax=Sulfobacillus thermotolerans TaxID=338644 RepID=A0ABN5H0Q5_9FIRM|nr:hypothetical protein BXT84_09480 [Sulfobacillus thermotolerans]MCY0908181.1 hypothetical protein [Sulfobacillus thermotolerans]PSR35996.1 MAG: hypothetical protein C7B44_11325 [Sulfobacillus thermosulfidooxidans]
MTLPEFTVFYSQLNPDRLGKVYDNALKMLTDRLASGQESPETLSPVILDAAMILSTHLLHEYHNWLAQSLASTAKDE